MNFKVEKGQMDKQKLIIIVVLSVIVVISIIGAIFFSLKGKAEDKNIQANQNSDPASITYDEENQQQVSKPGAENILDNKEAEIVELVKQYRAAMAAADIEALKNIYDADEVMNSSAIMGAADVITAYENTACYIRDGLEANTKVVFVYDELRVTGIDVLVPNVDYVYVRQNDDGELFIYPGEYDPEVNNYYYTTEIQTFIQNLMSDTEIRQLYNDMTSKLVELRKENESLEALIQEFIGNTDGDTKEADDESQSTDESDESESDAGGESEPDTQPEDSGGESDSDGGQAV